MIDSAKIGYGISLLGEAILREGFFDGETRCRENQSALVE